MGIHSLCFIEAPYSKNGYLVWSIFWTNWDVITSRGFQHDTITAILSLVCMRVNRKASWSCPFQWNESILKMKTILWSAFKWKWTLNIDDIIDHFQGLNFYSVVRTLQKALWDITSTYEICPLFFFKIGHPFNKNSATYWCDSLQMVLNLFAGLHHPAYIDDFHGSLYALSFFIICSQVHF